jgi:nitroreductase
MKIVSITLIITVCLLSCININSKNPQGRKSLYPINDVFINRSSPRAMSGKITKEELLSLFEAARWAPSSYNEQPWRFIYGFRGTDAWDKLFDLLVPFNQSWAKNGSVLVLIVSRKNFSHNNQPSATHSFDTGAAWENITLQGYHMNLVVHGMAGFDYERARKEYNIPDDYQVEAMFVIGRPGKKEDLPLDLQDKEVPSGRKTVDEFAFEGTFKS